MKIELFEKLLVKFGKTRPWKIGLKTIIEFFVEISATKSMMKLYLVSLGGTLHFRWPESYEIDEQAKRGAMDSYRLPTQTIS